MRGCGGAHFLHGAALVEFELLPQGGCGSCPWGCGALGAGDPEHLQAGVVLMGAPSYGGLQPSCLALHPCPQNHQQAEQRQGQVF